MEFDENGRELPDPTPVALPAGVGRPESLQDSIRRMIRNEMSLAASAQGQETFEEANDFDMDDDDYYSPYELSQMQDEAVLPKDGEDATKGGRDGAVKPENEDGNGRGTERVEDDRPYGRRKGDSSGKSGSSGEADGAERRAESVQRNARRDGSGASESGYVAE